MDGNLRVQCINLKYRSDRWAQFSAQRAYQEIQSKFPFEKFDAVRGDSIDIQHDSRVSLRTKRNIRDRLRRSHEELDSPGGVGCQLSHTEIWKKVVAQKEPYAIIFEDDAILPNDFLSELRAAWEDLIQLPRFPDLWQFSTESGYFQNSMNQTRPSQDSLKIRGPWTTQTCSTFVGQMITKEAAKKMLESAFPLDMQVDLQTCLLGNMGSLFSVRHKDIVITQRVLHRKDTDIQGNTCELCDIPTRYNSQGILMIHLPILLLAIGAMAGMSQLRTKR